MRVAVTNAYHRNPNLNAYRRRIANTKVAVIAGSEMQNVGKIPGYTRFSAPGDRYARETALYVRSNLRVDGHFWYTATKDVGGAAHRRTSNMVLLPFGGERWAPIVLHANPGRRPRATFQNGILHDAVLEMAELAQARGFTPIIMGDFNRRADERGRGTPYNLARRLNGAFSLQGIDGIVLPENARFATFRNRGRPPGSDHPLIVSNVKKRSKP